MTKKIFVKIVLLFIALITIGVAFIKLDPSGAAEFTDNILRPALGANTVVFLEKVFFNTSDKVQQLTTKESSIHAPNFRNSSPIGQTAATGLELNNIPVNPTFKPLDNEGVWQSMPMKTFPGQTVMGETFVRPDPDRPYVIVTIAQLDMTKMNLAIVAGTKEPGGKLGNFGPGKVPQNIVDNNLLVAAFDGGFQYRDGSYGMIVDGKTYVPLQNNLGTMVGFKDGSLEIIDYTGQDLGPDVAFIRQNCPILVEDGNLGVEDPKNKALWGRTPTTDIYTWRTGMGLTKNGNLLFAVGNSLTPTTLATALKMAGAVNAIQLDINPFWVRFNIFSPLGNGKYNSTTLTHDLKNGASAYLNGYTKDFFYLYKK